MSYEKEVQAGSEWLDRTSKGWYQKINLHSLNLFSWDCCVLGQLGGTAAARHTILSNPAEAASRGFVILGLGRIPEVDPVESYRPLTNAWEQEIQRRLESDKLQAEALNAAEEKQKVTA